MNNHRPSEVTDPETERNRWYPAVEVTAGRARKKYLLEQNNLGGVRITNDDQVVTFRPEEVVYFLMLAP